MLTPSYLYRNDFSRFRELLLAYPHDMRAFGAGELLWRPGEYIERTYFIEHGIVKTVFVNEDGSEKTIHFHGAGYIFPGCHETIFTIELSLVSTALTPVSAIEFPIDVMQQALREHTDLTLAMLESYARYINLLLFESAHQGHYEALIKLSNLIYLLAHDNGGTGRVDFSQEELAEILGVNRVSVARLLRQLRDEGAIASRRGGLTVTDEAALLRHCTSEVI